jgi:hypothetical protein
MGDPVLVIPSSTLPGMIISFHVLKALVSLLSVRSPYIDLQKNKNFQNNNLSFHDNFMNLTFHSWVIQAPIVKDVKI